MMEMIKRKRGKITNIFSNISRVLQPDRGIYAISIGGSVSSHESDASGVGTLKIYVNAIAPAPTMTDLNWKYFEEHQEDQRERLRSNPLGRLGDLMDYVGMAIVLESRASDFITRRTIFVDGGSILI